MSLTSPTAAEDKIHSTFLNFALKENNNRSEVSETIEEEQDGGFYGAELNDEIT